MMLEIRKAAAVVLLRWIFALWPKGDVEALHAISQLAAVMSRR